VVYYSTSGKNSNSNYKRLSLDELLKTSNIISIHAPLNSNTKNLLNKDNLYLIEDNSILLNLGRGGIINEEDLAKFIDTKRVYVGLDVVSKEPIDENNPLMSVKNRDNLLITPHIAWTSKEARESLVDGIIKNIRGFLDG